MRQYLIDELRLEDYHRLKAYLDERFAVPDFEGLYWIDLVSDQLTDVQKAHQDCRPFYFALELLPDRLSCELLVRSRQRVRCDCIRYASENQRNWIIGKVDAIFDELKLIN
jgi:hypothetical protein